MNRSRRMNLLTGTKSLTVFSIGALAALTSSVYAPSVHSDENFGPNLGSFSRDRNPYRPSIDSVSSFADDYKVFIETANKYEGRLQRTLDKNPALRRTEPEGTGAYDVIRSAREDAQKVDQAYNRAYNQRRELMARMDYLGADASSLSRQHARREEIKERVEDAAREEGFFARMGRYASLGIYDSRSDDYNYNQRLLEDVDNEISTTTTRMERNQERLANLEKNMALQVKRSQESMARTLEKIERADVQLVGKHLKGYAQKTHTATPDELLEHFEKLKDTYRNDWSVLISQGWNPGDIVLAGRTNANEVGAKLGATLDADKTFKFDEATQRRFNEDTLRTSLEAGYTLGAWDEMQHERVKILLNEREAYFRTKQTLAENNITEEELKWFMNTIGPEGLRKLQERQVAGGPQDLQMESRGVSGERVQRITIELPADGAIRSESGPVHKQAR